MHPTDIHLFAEERGYFPLPLQVMLLEEWACFHFIIASFESNILLQWTKTAWKLQLQKVWRMRRIMTTSEYSRNAEQPFPNQHHQILSQLYTQFKRFGFHFQSVQWNLQDSPQGPRNSPGIHSQVLLKNSSKNLICQVSLTIQWEHRWSGWAEINLKKSKAALRDEGQCFYSFQHSGSIPWICTFKDGLYFQ